MFLNYSSRQKILRLLTLVCALVLPAHSTATEFKGVIGKTEAESTPWWPPQARPDPSAPNILIWMLDDVGFGHLANFGGLAATPSIDGLADAGLSFTNFHATPLCSPTRASTLAGRNSHAIGMGAHANTPAGYPGYNARIPKSAASIARILGDAGYATYALGKWDHLPSEHVSELGPFDYWPSGQGFQHFYGFLSYDNHQFTPLMWRDHTPVNDADRDDPDYHLTTDIADQAIQWIENQHALDAQRPFFMYWATGAVHAPHHAPQAYIDKYRGKFDMGWNKARELILSRQKSLGMVPADAQLPPWPDNVPAWDTLSTDQQRMAARAMEVFAAMLDHSDHEFGRIVDSLRRTGQLENTVIIVVSDNGASAEGGLAGSFNELLMGQVDWDDNLQHFDDWGGPDTYPHYPVGWAAAGNTPFKYYKQSAHEGGTRVPMVISWPAGISDKGGFRGQFHHVNDIVPTLLDIAAVTAPAKVDGVPQQPMDGTSFRYALNDAAAPTTKKVQYFELWGNRGIYADGWKAVALLRPEPWDVFKRLQMDQVSWELYHVDEDFNERVDLAAKHPQKLAELQQLFDQEAVRNNVYPLAPDPMKVMMGQMQARLRQRQGEFEFYPRTSRVPGTLAPPINILPFAGSATLHNVSASTNGVIFAYGGNDGGLALYLQEGVPVFAYNRAGAEITYIRGTRPLPPGSSTLAFDMNKSSATDGEFSMSVDGKQFANGKLVRLGSRVPTHETFDIAADWGSQVSPQYSHKGEMPADVVEKVTISILQP
jgi:arylsulfatase A-like enzyme